MLCFVYYALSFQLYCYHYYHIFITYYYYNSHIYLYIFKSNFAGGVFCNLLLLKRILPKYVVAVLKARKQTLAYFLYFALLYLLFLLTYVLFSLTFFLIFLSFYCVISCTYLSCTYSHLDILTLTYIHLCHVLIFVQFLLSDVPSVLCTCFHILLLIYCLLYFNLFICCMVIWGEITSNPSRSFYLTTSVFVVVVCLIIIILLLRYLLSHIFFPTFLPAVHTYILHTLLSLLIYIILSCLFVGRSPLHPSPLLCVNAWAPAALEEASVVSNFCRRDIRRESSLLFFFLRDWAACASVLELP